MITKEELFKHYRQEIKDKDYRLESLSYNKGFVFYIVIYTESAIKKIEVDKKTFKKLAKFLNKGFK